MHRVVLAGGAGLAVTGVRMGTPNLVDSHPPTPEVPLQLPPNMATVELGMGGEKAPNANVADHIVWYTKGISACTGIIVASFTEPPLAFHAYYFCHVIGGDLTSAWHTARNIGSFMDQQTGENPQRQFYAVAASGGMGEVSASANKEFLVKLKIPEPNVVSYANTKSSINLAFVPRTGMWGEVLHVNAYKLEQALLAKNGSKKSDVGKSKRKAPSRGTCVLM